MYGDEAGAFCAGGILGIFLGVIFGLVTAGCDMRALKKSAVDKGHAEYNQRSGEWQWKELPNEARP